MLFHLIFAFVQRKEGACVYRKQVSLSDYELVLVLCMTDTS